MGTHPGVWANDVAIQSALVSTTVTSIAGTNPRRPHVGLVIVVPPSRGLHAETAWTTKQEPVPRLSTRDVNGIATREAPRPTFIVIPKGGPGSVAREAAPLQHSMGIPATLGG